MPEMETIRMGGSSLAGGHVLLNSVAFENKAKGIQ